MESHGWGDSHSHRCEVNKMRHPHPLCVRVRAYVLLSFCVSIPLLSLSMFTCAYVLEELLQLVVHALNLSSWWPGPRCPVGSEAFWKHTHHFVCAYRKLFLMLMEVSSELMLYNMPFPIKLAVFSPYKFLQSFWHAFCKVLGQLVVSSLSCACRKSPDSPPPPSNIFHWNLSWMKFFQKRKMVLENCLKFCVFSSWNQLILWGFVFVVGSLTNCGGYS